MNNKRIAALLEEVRTQAPLIHNITNVVVTNFTANGLLALGASPVMAYAKEEVADMARISNALVLNMGTLTSSTVESMIIAGKSANEHGVPVVFDPVGAGATPYRLETARRITDVLNISIIRANAAEIANLIGEAGEIKGVDAGKQEGDLVSLAQSAANKLETVIVMTGKTDIITDGKVTYKVHNGHEMLTKVTGTGCLLTSVTGAFAGVHGDLIEAALAAVVAYGVAAETAFQLIKEMGPGSFQIEFLNQLYKVSRTELEKLASYELV